MSVRKPKFQTFEVLGIPVCATTQDDIVNAVVAWRGDGIGRMVSAPDVSNVVRAQDNEVLRRIHSRAAIVSPDGMPLVWIGRLKGFVVDRCSGPDVMDRVIGRTVGQGLRHYFFGGREGVASRLREAFEYRYPGCQIVGHGTPPFRPMKDDEMDTLVGDIVASGADVVWLGLSTPKQEFLMSELVGRVPCTIFAVGAAFDFHTGEVERAPVWMQRAGMEWVFRFWQEPRRLWPRYLLMAPRFVWLLLTRELLRRSPRRGGKT